MSCLFLATLLIVGCSTPPGPVDSGWRRYDTVAFVVEDGHEQARVTIVLAPGETIVAIGDANGWLARLEVRVGTTVVRQYAPYVNGGQTGDAIPVVAWSGDGGVTWAIPADTGLAPWSMILIQ